MISLKIISNYVSKNTQYLVSFDGDFDLELHLNLLSQLQIFPLETKENPNKENLTIENIYFSIPIVNLINRSYIPEHLIVNKLSASIKISDRAIEEKTPLADLNRSWNQRELITLTKVEHRQKGDSISLW